MDLHAWHATAGEGCLEDIGQSGGRGANKHNLVFECRRIDGRLHAGLNLLLCGKKIDKAVGPIRRVSLRHGAAVKIDQRPEEPDLAIKATRPVRQRDGAISHHEAAPNQRDVLAVYLQNVECYCERQ